MPEPQNERDASPRRDESAGGHEPSRGDIVRTWSILIGLMALYGIWFGIIYLLQPGIR